MTYEKRIRYYGKPECTMCGEKFNVKKCCTCCITEQGMILDLYTQYQIAFNELNAGDSRKIDHLIDTTDGMPDIPAMFFDQNTTVFAVEWCIPFRKDIWFSPEDFHISEEMEIYAFPKHWLHYLSKRGNGNVLVHYLHCPYPYILSEIPRSIFSCSIFIMQHLAAWRWIMQERPFYLAFHTQKYIKSMDKVIDDAFAPHMSHDCQRLVEQYLNYTKF
jgi:hypothetical protein